MRAVLLGLGVALIAGSAIADCYPNNPEMPEAGMHCYGGGGTSVRQRVPGCSVFEAMVLGCLPSAERRDRLRHEVAQLISAGRCDEAFQKAMSGDDFDTAQKVRQLCQPAPLAAP